MARNSSGLSKSLILKGLQCPKALWLSKNPPAFDLPPRPDLEAKFAAGTKVGLLAQRLFPGGIEVPYEGMSFPAQLARTRELIDRGAPVIYEASFSFSAIFVKVDILVRDGDAWQIHEVKMGTGVKPVNLDDVAIQHYVLNGCGLKISADYLVHIDTDYVRQGELDVTRLFKSADITAKVMARQQGLPEAVRECRQVLGAAREPATAIGPHCHTPWDCDFIPYCWRDIPENSVFDLRGTGADKFALYRQGLLRFHELPLDQLNARQRQQVEATLTRKDVIDTEKLREFLDSLWFPLCCLDFETSNDPVPLFDGTRPYQQVPFQFSIHLRKTRGAKLEHHEFLAPPASDPRRRLAEGLLAVIPEDACILVYNQSFEKGVIGRLAEQFADIEVDLLKRAENIRDLMEPFRQRHIYCWQFNGSYSIKEVLPVLAPELSYGDLDVADGQAAMRAYRMLKEASDPAEQDRLRQALLAYCRQDTLAMVRILDALESVLPP